MNKQELQETLHDLAEEKIPVVVNRWTAIRAKALAEHRTSSRFAFYQISGAATLVMVLLIGLGVFTLYRQNQVAPSLPTPVPLISETGDYRTHLNISRTIRGYTVTLEWMYVDEFSIQLRYNVVGRDENLVRKIASPKYLVLRDTLNNRFYSGGSGQFNRAANSWWSPEIEKLPDGRTKLTDELEFRTEVFHQPVPPGVGYTTTTRDYLKQYATPPDELTLLLELNVEGVVIPPEPTLADLGDLFGFGGVEVTAEVIAPPVETPIPTATPIQPGPADVFTLVMDVPVYQKQVLTPDLKATVNDLTLTLTRLEITPLITVATLCLGLPEDAGWRIKEPTLTAGDLAGTWKIIDDDPICDRLYFNLENHSGMLTLSFPYFQNGGDADFPQGMEEYAAIQPFLEKQGLTVKITDLGQGGYHTEILKLDGSKLTDVDYDKIYRDVLYEAGLRQRLYGPWEFKIAIP